MLARPLAILTLLLLAAAPASALTVNDFCAAGADPCEFNGTAALNADADTVLDFGDRTVIIGSSRRVNVTGGVDLTITAGAFIMRLGSRIGNAATAQGATISITTDDDIVLEGVVGSRSQIEVPGTINGGRILLTAGGNIEIDGALRADGTTADASGGLIDMESGGTVTLGGTVNLRGDIAGLGGELVVGADGPIVVNAPVDASGGLDGGSIDLSGESASTTEVLDVRGSVGGSGGGAVAIIVDGSISIGNRIFAHGFGSVAGGGGFGGEVDMQAGGSIAINDIIDLSGGAPEGTGGFGFFEAQVDIIQKRSVLGVGAGSGGTGGDLTYSAGRLLSLEALNDLTGSESGGTFAGTGRGELQVKSDVIVNGVGIGGSGGSIELDGLVAGVQQVSGNIVVGGALRARGDTDGGSIVIQGCNVTVPQGGVLDNAGAAASNAFRAGGLLTIAGRVDAGPNGQNTLEFRDLDKQPVLTGTFAPPPPPTPSRVASLPGCQPPVPPVCGDGELQSVEGCDDGNLDSCDGCSGGANSMTCQAAGCCQEEACGNGRRECDEECDDGNVADGDGCDSNCTPTACGNGRVTGTEECDDDNTTAGDGCDANCLIEPPPGCGNGMADDGEACDDNNNNNCDGCSKICVVEACGNGVKQCAEACDDGGTAACDGECAADCSREVKVCGDGITECGEECDAGAANGTPGSSCSGFCRTCAIGSGGDCPCGTDFDCAPTGRCAGLACLSGACTSIGIPACNDGNDCNGVESCVNGECTAPTTPSCIDDDPCTDDTCNPVGGCPHARKTGFPGISCRLELIESLADSAAVADLPTKLRAKVLKLSSAARTRITAAGQDSNPKKQKKLLKAAEKQLTKLLATINKGLKKKQITDTLGNRLREQADGARSAAKTLRQGLSG